MRWQRRESTPPRYSSDGRLRLVRVRALTNGVADERGKAWSLAARITLLVPSLPQRPRSRPQRDPRNYRIEIGMGGWGRLRGLARRFGPVMSMTAVSQTLAAAALLLVPVAFGDQQSDTYALGIQTGGAGLSGIVIGVIYNLAVGRRTFARWAVWAMVSALGTLLLSVLTIVYLGAVQSAIVNSVPGVAVLAIYTFGGAALAFGATFCVRASLAGRPAVLASVTIFPNGAMIACVILLLALEGHDDWYLAPAIVWATAALIQIPSLYKRSNQDFPTPAATARDNALFVHALALVVGAITSMLLPNLYFAAVTQLEAGTATWVLIVGRVGAAAVGLLVNSILLVKYSWSRDSTGIGRLPAVVAALALVVGLLAFSLSGWLPTVGHVLVAAMLLLTLVPASIVLREMNARAKVSAVSVKVVVDLVISVLLLVALTDSPSISGYFGVFVASQASTMSVLSFFMERNALRWLGPVTLVAAIMLVVLGW